MYVSQMEIWSTYTRTARTQKSTTQTYMHTHTHRPYIVYLTAKIEALWKNWVDIHDSVSISICLRVCVSFLWFSYWNDLSSYFTIFVMLSTLLAKYIYIYIGTVCVGIHSHFFSLPFFYSFWMSGSKHIRKEISNHERKNNKLPLNSEKAFKKKTMVRLSLKMLNIGGSSSSSSHYQPHQPYRDFYSSFFYFNSFFLSFLLLVNDEQRRQRNEQMGERTWVCNSHVFSCSCFLFRFQACLVLPLFLCCLLTLHRFVYWFLSHTNRKYEHSIECILGHTHSHKTTCCWWWGWYELCFFGAALILWKSLLKKNTLKH